MGPPCDMYPGNMGAVIRTAVAGSKLQAERNLCPSCKHSTVRSLLAVLQGRAGILPARRGAQWGVAGSSWQERPSI